MSQITSDATGHVTGATDRTVKIPNTTATTSAAGLMSSDDKTKLNGIAEGANNYVLPGSTDWVMGGVTTTLGNDNTDIGTEEEAGRISVLGTSGNKHELYVQNPIWG